MTALQASILIPAYNAERYIGQAIDSALSQADVSVEVIVVDDGSTDNTLSVIRRYDGRIKWESGPNKGAPSARNRALALASAPWVQYLDADDYLMPDKVHNQLQAVENYPEADIMYGPSTIEWQHGDTTESSIEPITEPFDPYILLALWKLPQTGAVLMKRSAVIDVGGWDEAQPCCQEHDLYLRLIMRGANFVYDPAGGSVYRRFETGTLSTSNLTMVRFERRKIENRLEQYLRSIGKLSPERLWAIDQARFEMARSAWPVSRNEAKEIHGEIVSVPFRPNGRAAPTNYRVAYKLGGFQFAETLAALQRNIRKLWIPQRD